MARVPVEQLVDNQVRCVTCGAAIHGCECRPDMRNDDNVPVVTHSGTLHIGEAALRCYVLDNGQRIFDGNDLAQFLGLFGAEGQD